MYNNTIYEINENQITLSGFFTEKVRKYFSQKIYNSSRPIYGINSNQTKQPSLGSQKKSFCCAVHNLLIRAELNHSYEQSLPKLLCSLIYYPVL